MSIFKKAKSFATGSILGGLTGAAIGGPLGAVAGGLLGGYTSYQADSQAAKQNKASQAAIDRANAYDLRMWNLVNTYNDPKAQMQRLADAGLNPNLVYGSGNVTGNTAGAPGSNGSAESYVADKVGNSIQAAQLLANLASTRQGIANQRASLDFTDAQTRALNHNLRWARDHNLPVGQQTSISSTTGQVANDLLGFGKNMLDKGGQYVLDRKRRSDSYYERNKDRPLWDLVKEQWHDMWN